MTANNDADLAEQIAGHEIVMKERFRQELASLLNSYSMENGSDTPDFILADYLIGCLVNLDRTVKAREVWYGRATALPIKDASDAYSHAHTAAWERGATATEMHLEGLKAVADKASSNSPPTPEEK